MSYRCIADEQTLLKLYIFQM